MPFESHEFIRASMVLRGRANTILLIFVTANVSTANIADSMALITLLLQFLPNNIAAIDVGDDLDFSLSQLLTFTLP